MSRNRHHTKKGPGRVHFQGMTQQIKEVEKSWGQLKLEEAAVVMQRYVNQHPKGLLGRIFKHRLMELQQHLAEMKK